MSWIPKEFMVGSKPFCAWVTEDTNSAFLRGIDSRYFRYLAELHAPNVDNEHRNRAAMALRAAYYHGLETLFTLIFAGLQSPYCLVGWLLKCHSEDLREIVQGVTDRKSKLGSSRWKNVPESWDGISELIYGTLLNGESEQEQACKRFSGLWGKFAEHFVQGFVVNEYNSFKHGLRLNIGAGPSITFNPPPGANGEASKMMSEFGSTFFQAEPIDENNSKQLRHVFKLKYCHVNIDPKSLVHWLILASISIENVVSFLKYINRFPSEGINCLVPVESAFENPSGAAVGQMKFIALNPKISLTAQGSTELSAARIKERLLNMHRKQPNQRQD